MDQLHIPSVDNADARTNSSLCGTDMKTQQDGKSVENTDSYNRTAQFKLNNYHQKKKLRVSFIPTHRGNPFFLGFGRKLSYLNGDNNSAKHVRLIRNCG